MTLSIAKLGWRSPDAQIALAEALGRIAADLWLAGKVSLTNGHLVATMTHTDATSPKNDTGQVGSDQAEGCGSRRQIVA